MNNISPGSVHSLTVVKNRYCIPGRFRALFVGVKCTLLLKILPLQYPLPDLFQICTSITLPNLEVLSVIGTKGDWWREKMGAV